jgi:hypothetical protein
MIFRADEVVTALARTGSLKKTILIDSMSLQFSAIVHAKNNAVHGIYVLVFAITFVLEPVCSKKRQKIIPDQTLVCGVGTYAMKDLKDSKLILNESKLFP